MADMVDHAAENDNNGPPPAGAPTDSAEDLEIQTNWDETTTTFDAMDLKEDLLRGIYAYGFEKPSAIQQRAVKPILIGRDVIAQAQSGKQMGNSLVILMLRMKSEEDSGTLLLSV